MGGSIAMNWMRCFVSARHFEPKCPSPLSCVLSYILIHLMHGGHSRKKRTKFLPSQFVRLERFGHGFVQKLVLIMSSAITIFLLRTNFRRDLAARFLLFYPRKMTTGVYTADYSVVHPTDHSTLLTRCPHADWLDAAQSKLN